MRGGWIPSPLAVKLGLKEYPKIFVLNLRASSEPSDSKRKKEVVITMSGRAQACEDSI